MKSKKPTKAGAVELTEEDLENVQGGKAFKVEIEGAREDKVEPPTLKKGG